MIIPGLPWLTWDEQVNKRIAREYGEAIKACRGDLGITQKDLARESAVPVYAISEFERGLSIPGHDRHGSLARALRRLDGLRRERS